MEPFEASSVRDMPILVVDDDRHILEFFERILPKWGFSNVSCAPTPEEGLELLAQREYALVLLDYQMPGISGHEFRERGREISPGAIYVLITAHGNKHGEGLAESTMERDFHGYLDKPFKHNTIIAQVVGGLFAYVQGKTHQKIKEAKDEWLETMDNLPHLVFRVAASGRVLRLNRQALEYLQKTSYTEAIGREITGLIPESAEVIAAMHATGQRANREKKIGDRHYSIAAVPMHAGAPGYNLTCTDITVLVNAMEKCARADRFYSMGLTRATIASDANNFEAQLRLSLASVKTALSHFCMSVEEVIALRRWLPLLGKAYGDLDGIIRGLNTAVDRTCAINTRLAHYLRMEMKMAAAANAPRPRYRATNLDAFIKRFIAYVREDFPYAEISFREAEAPRPGIDEASFFTALYNICRNAAEARPDCNIDFRIAYLKEREQIKISISDNSGGMPKEIEARMFEPFYTTKETGEHLGFGLNSVRRTVKAHNGSLKALNQEGVGVTVEIYLPVSPAGEHSPLSELPAEAAMSAGGLREEET